MPISSSPAELLAELIELANNLPSDPTEYAVLQPTKRRALRAALEGAVSRLTALSDILDTVRQPRHVFDPTDPKVIGKVVADALLLQDQEPLAHVVTQSFYGAGVYAIYYKGPFECYQPISGRDHPIYVGKADPAELHAQSAAKQGTRLHTRLKDHFSSISRATNLEIEDFTCRYLVVRSAWVETAEDLLIACFKPVWNSEMKVCFGFGKHGDSSETRKNKRSPWDTIHPGRIWATEEGNTPNKKSVADICAAIAGHFKANPVNH